MKKYFFCIIIFTFFSCVSNSRVERVVSLDDLIIEEINNGLNNSEINEVFQLLTYYESKNFNNEFLEQSRKSLYDLYTVELKKLYEEKEWFDFFTLYENVSHLNLEIFQYDLQDILYNYIIEDIPNKLYKSGVLLGEAKLNYTLLSDEELIELFEEYNNVTYIDDFPILINELNLRNIEINSGDKGDFLDGVVTIYVNRGISFEDGVGRQDTVVGSGFFIDKFGHAVTNYHVVESMVDPEYEGVSELYIKLNGEVERIPAKVVGWDPILDLALIKISTKPTYSYSLSEDDNLVIGDKVVAIGSPGGLGSTVTSGIVSAISRTFLEIGSVIQIDSPINPGNSGGPLINENYEVNNIVFAGIESFEGVNFAIPGKYLKKGLLSLYEGGERKHVWLGAGITYRKRNLEVNYIKPNSPAFYLGLVQGDIIKGINGQEFSSVVGVQDYMMGLNPGEIIDVEYIHENKIYKKNISLAERPKLALGNIVDGDASDNLYIPLFGMDIKFTGKILWDKEYIIDDVYPGTVADDLNLKPGDIIKVKDWEYNEKYKTVILQFVIQSQKEGFWEKTIQVGAPITVNSFI